MPYLPAIEIPQELHDALLQRQKQTHESLYDLIPRLLALELLSTDSHENSKYKEYTMWQVSTTGALIRGIFSGACTVADVLSHGSFGLGTFEQLDGEMVILDGNAYQCRGDGSVIECDQTAGVPFATVTNFEPDITHTITTPIDSLAALIRSIDDVRPHGNQFYGIKVTGTFKKVHVRMACKVKPGVGLVEATKIQAEHEYSNVKGTLVEFWSPEYTVAFSIPGLHAHWLGDDLKTGGHVLDVVAEPGLVLQVHVETDFHCSLPDGKAFNEADLPTNIGEELGKAEGAQHATATPAVEPPTGTKQMLFYENKECYATVVDIAREIFFPAADGQISEYDPKVLLSKLKEDPRMEPFRKYAFPLNDVRVLCQSLRKSEIVLKSVHHRAPGLKEMLKKKYGERVD